MLLQKPSPAGCTLLSSSDDSLLEHWPTVPPPSPALRFHGKGSGDHELHELANEAKIYPISNPPPPASLASTQQYSWGKRALSFDSPSPSPLHHVVVAGISVDQDAVPGMREPWSKRHVGIPSWYYHNRGEQDTTATSEPPTPTSPTLSDCSMDSQTALIPPPSGKVRSQSHCSSLQMFRPPRSSYQISSPILDSSSIDATIRSSTTPGLEIDTADLKKFPTAALSKAGSWPNRHRRRTNLGENEVKISELAEPRSEFSDSEDEDEGERSRGKSFKRRLSGTFGHCFGGRKN